MWTKQKRRSNKSRYILPALTVIVLSYFSYHLFHGVYGLESLKKIEQHVVSLNKEYTALKQKNQNMREKIALLEDGSVEKDTLDEYARRNLNFSRFNELTIITSKEDNL